MTRLEYLLIILFAVVGIIVSLLSIIGTWLTYKKAGENGWAAIIPIYGTYVLYKIGDVPPILSLFHIGLYISSNYNNQPLPISIIAAICSLVAGVFHIKACLGIAKYFGKSTLFGIGLIILPFIFFLILGLKKEERYKKNP